MKPVIRFVALGVALSIGMTMVVYTEDYYRLLGVEKSATGDEIIKAYRNQFAKLKSGSQEMDELNFAYKTLSDTESRKQYDLQPASIETINQDLDAIFDDLEDLIEKHIVLDYGNAQKVIKLDGLYRNLVKDVIVIADTYKEGIAPVQSQALGYLNSAIRRLRSLLPGTGVYDDPKVDDAIIPGEVKMAKDFSRQRTSVDMLSELIRMEEVFEIHFYLRQESRELYLLLYQQFIAQEIEEKIEPSEILEDLKDIFNKIDTEWGDNFPVASDQKEYFQDLLQRYLSGQIDAVFEALGSLIEKHVIVDYTNESKIKKLDNQYAKLSKKLIKVGANITQDIPQKQKQALYYLKLAIERLQSMLSNSIVSNQSGLDALIIPGEKRVRSLFDQAVMLSDKQAVIAQMDQDFAFHFYMRQQSRDLFLELMQAIVKKMEADGVASSEILQTIDTVLAQIDQDWGVNFPVDPVKLGYFNGMRDGNGSNDTQLPATELQLPAEQTSVDIVMSSKLFEELSDAFEQLSSALRQGGTQ